MPLNILSATTGANHAAGESEVSGCANTLLVHRLALTGYLNLAQEVLVRASMSGKKQPFSRDINKTFSLVEEGAVEFIAMLDEILRIQDCDKLNEVPSDSAVDGFNIKVIQSATEESFPRVAKSIYDSYMREISQLENDLAGS